MVIKPRTKLNHNIFIKMMLANWEGAGVERYQVYTQTLALPTSSFFFSIGSWQIWFKLLVWQYTQANREKWKKVIIDSWEKVSLDKKSLQIFQAKSCDFILNPDFTCNIFLMTGLTSDLLWFSCSWYNCGV